MLVLLLAAVCCVGAASAADEVTVTFSPHGGSGEEYTQIMPKGTNTYLTPCTFTAPEGKAFAGWAETSDGKISKVNKELYKTSTDSTLYAVWYSVQDVSLTLSENKELLDNLVIPADKNVVIDLNGHSLSGNGKDSVIVNYGTLTIKDSVGEGKITGGNGINGGGD